MIDFDSGETFFESWEHHFLGSRRKRRIENQLPALLFCLLVQLVDRFGDLPIPTQSITITPTASDANAVIKVNGAPVASGAAIALIDEHGATRITLRSTNGDALVTFADRDRRVRLSAGTRSDGTVVVPEDLRRP